MWQRAQQWERLIWQSWQARNNTKLLSCKESCSHKGCALLALILLSIDSEWGLHRLTCVSRTYCGFRSWWWCLGDMHYGTKLLLSWDHGDYNYTETITRVSDIYMYNVPWLCPSSTRQQSCAYSYQCTHVLLSVVHYTNQICGCSRSYRWDHPVIAIWQHSHW